ncbi:hypothetical protein AOQ84DRAFT_355054 [Glonium stellatum]|uniref:Uncharacterized protein n=1 Tax=Glonium stellatum TaxID=574774 RepID=A0A8E2EZ26_9PEZI|nr:hypothetical protein AOQ84DRAFT_355054 [Glonium stellatum]
MSHTIKPTFVYNGGWSDETRTHPAMKWMENYTVNVVDAKKFDLPATQCHTDNFVLQKSDGTVIKGADAGWEAEKQIYNQFVAHSHEPQALMCCETESGWQMIGQADVYVMLPGTAGPDEKKVKSKSGKEWDAVIPAAYQFEYVKDASGQDGIKLSSAKIFSDPLPALTLLLKRGVVTPQDLLK